MLAVLLMTTFLSYAKLDLQIDILPIHQHLANPQRSSFVESDHKVLIGIFDTGVDYNHPYLRDSIHWDDNGVGIDFVGQDNFPYPNLVRTSEYDYPSNKDLATHWGKTVLQMALSYGKKFASWGDPMRHMAQEKKYAVWHGTHVAGLASYDEPQIGIVPYRAVPIDNDKHFNPIRLLAKRLEKAFEHASQNGVRIINFSGGADVRKAEISEELYQDHLVVRDELEEVFSRYPEILLVVASGNMRFRDTDRLLDSENHLTIPCMVESENVLCVGAVDHYEEIADFTLIPPGRVIYANGKGILSTKPADSCYEMAELEFLDERDAHRFLDEHLEKIEEKCEKFPLFKQSSGTSMATPMVARMAAKILIKDPSIISAKTLIEKIFESSLKRFSKGRTIQVIKKEKPSWYQLFDHYDASGKFLPAPTR